MSGHISFLRGSFLYLSRQKALRNWMETSPHAHKLTGRFIAGLTLEDGIRVIREQQMRGATTSLDHLGENVKTAAEACAARDAYLDALRRIAELQLPATISMKLTSVGLDISEDLCRENSEAIVSLARDNGSRVEFDMEDSSYVDRTLRLIRELHEKFGSVRAVIQAYLYRSEADVEDLSRRGVPIRLCKGAYQEPPEVAWANKADVDRNYVKLMQVLFDRGAYPAIATHDDAIVGQAYEYIRRKNVGPDQFEFQMLYGVRRGLQQQVLGRGYRLRVYVPYGTAWYPYFMRRLAERPANVMFIARSILKD